MSDIKGKVISGTLWATADRFISMGIQFLTNLILARLLMPSDFGCIGMLAIFILVSQTIIDGGFGSALIQKKEPTQTDYSTIFYVNLLFAIVLYGVLFFSSPLIASFYRMPILNDALRVWGVVLLINSLVTIQNNRLRKTLAFKQIAIVNVSSYFIAAFIAVTMAIEGYGVWSLVFLQLIYSCLSVVFYGLYTRWHPSLCFSFQSLRALFGFGSYILFSNILQEVCKNLQGLIIGRRFSSTEMGLYSQAKKLGDVVYYTLPNVLVQVMFPVYSKFQMETARLREMVRMNVRVISFITFPLMMLLIETASPLVTFLYGDKWEASVPYFQLLCVGGLFVCLQNINYYAIAALGKSRVLFGWSFYKWGTLLVLLLVGMHWGMYGILCGMVISELNIYLVNAALVAKYVSYPVWRQLLDILPILLVALVTCVTVYVMGNTWHIHFFLQILMFAAVYIVLVFLFRLQVRKDVFMIVGMLRNKRNS